MWNFLSYLGQPLIFFNLPKFQFNRSLPAENLNRNAQLVAFIINFFYNAVKISKRTFIYAHFLPNLKFYPRFGFFTINLNLSHNYLNLFL
ncbi:Uncharacterised protein [Kingella potus]|uniref:Uncharacterized protein n=1 Tax=Kingella potus TaxID=265175 RepID=A0A377R3E8_9NEIS|nr:Uncharacterised protein [Kingella potus]